MNSKDILFQLVDKLRNLAASRKVEVCLAHVDGPVTRSLPCVYASSSLASATKGRECTHKRRWGYAEITEADKCKILGLNSTRLYGIGGVGSGNLSERFREVPADYEDRMSDDFKFCEGYSSHRMHAHAHLEAFYGRLGFRAVGEHFLDADIEHVLMIRND